MNRRPLYIARTRIRTGLAIAALTAMALSVCWTIVAADSIAQGRSQTPSLMISGSSNIRFRLVPDATGAASAQNERSRIHWVYPRDNSKVTVSTFSPGQQHSLFVEAERVVFTPQSLTIPLGASTTISYRVVVPEQLDSLRGSGTYWSMLMVEGIDRASAESTLSDEADGSEQREVGFR